MHGAGAARSDAATEFRSGQSELLAQDPEQWSLGLDIDLTRSPIDSDVGHDVRSPSLSGSCRLAQPERLRIDSN
jgi:hypothetical protein